jgi:hypothetical protein
MSELCNYLLKHRQVGQTTAMVNGAINYDRPFFILSGTFISALEISKKSRNKNAIPLSVDQLSQLRGNDYPILIDGFAVTTEIENINRMHNKELDLQQERYKYVIDCLEKKIEDEAKFYQSKISYLGRYLNEANKSLNESNEKIEKLDIRVNKTRKRLKPTLEGFSRLSLWDRIFNYKSKVGEIVEDYLY